MKTKTKKTKTMKEEISNKHFHVTIFGSARIKKDDKVYKQVFNLAKDIAKHKWDIVTGGGPGLMEAANAGHEAGDPQNMADSIGLTIQLPWENKGNKYLETQKHFQKFSNRLDNFMALSDAVIIMPGGIGTSLEFFYTMQLTQVRHMNPIPVIVVGKMWSELVKWIKEYPIKTGLVSPHDIDNLHVAKNNKDAIEILKKAFKQDKNHKGSNYKLD